MISKRQVFAATCSLFALTAAVGCTSSPDVKLLDWENAGPVGKQTWRDGTPPDKIVPCQHNMHCTMMTVNTGEKHVLAMNSEGEVWGWGNNASGQVWNGTTNPRTTPVKIPLPGPASAVSGGPDSSVAIVGSEGKVYVWGAFTSASNNFSVPIRMSASGPDFEGAVAVTMSHYNVFILKENREIYGFGDISFDALAGSNGAYASRILAGESATQGGCTGGFLCDIIAVAAQGCYANAALKSDGSVYGWGNAVAGDGSYDASLPRKVRVGQSDTVGCTGFLCGITDIAVGGSSGSGFAIALHNTGAVFTWGYNSAGELGDGTNTSSPYPRRVIAPDHTVAANGIDSSYGQYLKDIIAIGSGSHAAHAAAIDKDGNLWTWGLNLYGQLGNGTTSSYINRPVRVMKQGGTEPLSGVWSVSGGGDNGRSVGFKVALTVDGNFWSWGENNNGQHGNGTTNALTTNNYPVLTNFDYKASSTSGMPTCMDGVCMEAQWCIIGGKWYAPNQTNPDNPCEVCKPPVLTTWSHADVGDMCKLPIDPACSTRYCEAGGVCGNTVTPGCNIGTQCVIPGRDNPSNLCQFCDPNVTTEDWTTKPDGASCRTSVELPCQDRTCSDGVCGPQYTSTTHCVFDNVCRPGGWYPGTNECFGCDPGNSQTATTNLSSDFTCSTDDDIDCTENRCDGEGNCSYHPVAPGNCRIDDTCYDHGAINSENDCEYCDSNLDRNNWSPRPADAACLGSGISARPWADLVCDGARVCGQKHTGQCMIEGVLVPANEENSANPCEWCDPAVSASGWSAKPKGTACESDGFECTTNVCDGAGSCDAIVTDGCFIDDECFANRDTKPGVDGECFECNAAYTTGRFSPKPKGEPCGEGKACDGSGHCWPLYAAKCNIDDVEYENGALNPDNECERCDAVLNTGAWTYRAKGAECSSEGLPCVTASCDGFGTCDEQILFGCRIGDECLMAGAKDPENDCRECIPAVSREGYSLSAEGTVCPGYGGDFMQFLCNEVGVCVERTRGYCQIGEDTFDGGTVNPTNKCEWCDPEQNPDDWSYRPVNSPCGTDNLACTDDVCDDSGNCVNVVFGGCLIEGQCFGPGGVPEGEDCLVCNPVVDDSDFAYRAPGEACESLDGDPMMKDTCNDAGDCEHKPRGQCIITETTVVGGEAANPANSCEWCDPEKSTVGWSPKASTAPCASDSLDCTTDVCDGEGTCKHELASGNCLIGDKCVVANAKHPDDTCLECDPAADTTKYVAVVSDICQAECIVDADCDDDALECVDYKCVEKPECREDADCPEEQKCVAEHCVSEEKPECEVDADCNDDNLVCRNEKCVEKPECVEDADCNDDNLICRNEKCVEKPECTKDEECPGDKVCRSQKCVDEDKPECKEDSDCTKAGKGDVCIKQKCQVASLEGGGLGCSTTTAGGQASSAGAFGALLAALGLVTRWARRRGGGSDTSR